MGRSTNESDPASGPLVLFVEARTYAEQLAAVY